MLFIFEFYALQLNKKQKQLSEKKLNYYNIMIILREAACTNGSQILLVTLAMACVFVDHVRFVFDACPTSNALNHNQNGISLSNFFQKPSRNCGNRISVYHFINNLESCGFDLLSVDITTKIFCFLYLKKSRNGNNFEKKYR